ncbi:hypothetical protein [Pseudovibrio ascidiaceicola]|nr:hypothetical protein [Pseudovibrio ascidiaceicola]
MDKTIEASLAQFHHSEHAVIAYGVSFNPKEDTWPIHILGDRKHLHFQSFRKLTSAPLFTKIKRVFRVLAETRNSHTCYSALRTVVASAQSHHDQFNLSMAAISCEVIIMVQQQRSTGVAMRKALIKPWMAYGGNLIEEDVLDFIAFF